MEIERDVILDFIQSQHDGNALCTGYVLIATLTSMDDSNSDEFATYCDPEQRLTVGIGMLEAASAVFKARFVKESGLFDD